MSEHVCQTPGANGLYDAQVELAHIAILALDDGKRSTLGRRSLLILCEAGKQIKMNTMASGYIL
jgi:hypothetical protein